MPRLSIVIPCPGGAVQFEGTLVSVLQNRPTDCEVLVVHGEPYDDPYALDGEVRFIHQTGGGRVSLANTGIEQAASDIVHVLDCGLVAQEGWTEPALAHFADADVAAVSPVVLTADGQRVHAAGLRWTLGGARKIVNDQRVLMPGAGRLRSRILGPTIAAGFYRRDVLAALGGFEPGLTETLADAALALAIRQLGRLHVCEPASRLATSGEHHEPLAGGFSAGRAAERLFWRFASARGPALCLCWHPLTLIADVLSQLPRLGALTSLLGRLVALGEFGAVQRHQQRLESAADALTDQLQPTLRMPVQRPREETGAKNASRRRAA